MPISVTWGTRVINVPQSYLANITGTLYELNTDTMRLDLKALEDDEEGIPFPDTHRHNTEVTVAGITYARTIEIINSYSITFQDGQYSVRLVGSNNNFFDVENGILNQNQVQVIPGNAAGLIVSVQGSGITEQDKADIINGVWDDEDAARILGLLQENKVIDLTVHDGNGHLTSARIRLYDDDPAASGAVVIATYAMTAVWDVDEMTSYTMVRV